MTVTGDSDRLLWQLTVICDNESWRWLFNETKERAKIIFKIMNVRYILLIHFYNTEQHNLPVWTLCDPGLTCQNEGGSTLASLKVNGRTPVSLPAQHSLSLPVRYVVINLLVLPSPAPCTSLLSISSMALCRQVWQDSMTPCLIKFQAHANSWGLV